MLALPLHFGAASESIATISPSSRDIIAPMKVWIALLICAMALLGAETDEDQTLQLKNGRFWVRLDADQRTMFLVGLQDGWTLRGDTEASSLGAVFLVWGVRTYSIRN